MRWSTGCCVLWLAGCNPTTVRPPPADGITPPSPTQPAPAKATKPVQVAAGWGHTCALDGQRRVVCWGSNMHGVIGLPAREKTEPPRVVNVMASPTQITSGSTHSCVLTERGRVVCWGDNRGGEVGKPGELFVHVPHVVEPHHDFVHVAAGSGRTCAVRSGGEVLCWGNPSGLFGGTPRPLPEQVVGLPPATQVALRAAELCASTRGGEVWCWTHDIAPPSVSPSERRTAPQKLALPPSRQVVVGFAHACALDMNGQARCWGGDRQGVRGLDPASSPPALPTLVPGLTGVAALSAHSENTCALLQNGELRCWGSNEHHQLGTAAGAASHLPRTIPSLPPIASISSGRGDHLCAVSRTDEIFCWGAGRQGELGGAPTDKSAAPMRVALP